MSLESISLPEWLKRGVSDLFPIADVNDPDHNLELRLANSFSRKKPLRVKLGIDPTGTDIHLGHSILFRKLRAFQDAGHTAVLIIGDFTARIGDPTGKNKTRVQLSEDEIEKNAKNYLEQLGFGQSNKNSLLDFTTPGRLEIRRNSEWLKSLGMSEIIELLGNATVGQMLAKEDFNKRYSSGTPISLHEFLYPLLQGYDSVAVNADVELGGTDQKFNIGMGRDLQRFFGQTPQFGILLPILIGLDGSLKMSKSLGNIVGIKEDPLSMYSKLEKISDNLVPTYLTLLTDLNEEDLPTEAREIQKLMALTITANFHGINSAKSVQDHASKLIAGINDSQGEISSLSIKNVNFPAKAFYFLSAIGLSVSSSEARRQIQGGSVRLNGEKISDPNLVFSEKSELIGKVLQIGKKTFRRITH